MTPARSITAARVLHFWFSEAFESAAGLERAATRWFHRDADFDKAVRERFEDLPSRAADGEFDTWSLTPADSLARIIVLDQFPRNLCRDSALAFAHDRLALAGALDAMGRRHDMALHPLEASFLYLPLQHAENLTLQDRALQAYASLTDRAPDSMRARFREFEDYARRHRDVIARFGRFPHRNRLLGRPSTVAERRFLESGGERFE